MSGPNDDQHAESPPSSDQSFDESSSYMSSDDGELGCVALALDPSQLSEGTGLPQNGHDYLKLVQTEREKYPAVACAPPPLISTKPSSQTNKKIKLLQSDPPSSSSQPQTDHCDELKYRDEILSNFKELRAKIESIRDSIQRQELGLEVEITSDDIQLSEKQFKKQSNRAVKRASNLLKLMEIGQRPQVSTLIQHSQYELHLTLEKMADECEMTPHSSTIIHTDWLYSIMAALREPIEPDICSTLRRLARLCISKRKLYETTAKNREAQQQIGHNGLFEGSAGKASNVIAGTDGGSNGRKKRNGRRGCSGGATRGGEEENNEELVRQLEEEEYTSSLLIICIVRHHYGQVDLK